MKLARVFFFIALACGAGTIGHAVALADDGFDLSAREQLCGAYTQGSAGADSLEVIDARIAQIKKDQVDIGTSTGLVADEDLRQRLQTQLRYLQSELFGLEAQKQALLGVQETCQ